MLEKIQIVEPITLKDLRALTGKTQKEFADFVGIPVSSYVKYENNPSNMEVGRLAQICRICNVDMSKILVL